MKKEDIITLPHQHLRQKSRKVLVVDDSVRNLVQDMTDAALDWEDSRPHEISAALAAVQIDNLSRVIIVRTDFDKKEERDFTVLINPEIVKYEGEITSDYEGCLSVQDIYGKVPRYTKIRVKAMDLGGKQIRFKADGFLARVIQHEVDHTKGMLFIDHIQGDKDAFYELDEKGELQPLNYETSIAGSGLFND
jgi:peptide deformylase